MRTECCGAAALALPGCLQVEHLAAELEEERERAAAAAAAAAAVAASGGGGGNGGSGTPTSKASAAVIEALRAECAQTAMQLREMEATSALERGAAVDRCVEHYTDIAMAAGRMGGAWHSPHARRLALQPISTNRRD